jgi:hypothetical protein
MIILKRWLYKYVEMDGLVNNKDNLCSHSGKNCPEGDNSQMLFVRLNMKWLIAALSQKIMELCNQNFRSEGNLKDQLTQS